MNNQPIYWKKKNGEFINIDSMDLNHLRNTLKMIVKNNQKNKEFKLNGDMAEDYNTSNKDCCDATESDIY